VQSRGAFPKQKPIASLILAAGILLAGCTHQAVRVVVPETDMLRANEAAQEADIASSRKEPYAALIKYLEASRLNPNNENIFNRLGIIYAQLNLYDQSRAAFQRAIEINPKFPYAYNNLGSVFFLQRNLRKSEKYFRKAASLKENEASFHVNLGSLYIETKKSNKAMAEWHKAVTLDPEALTKSSAVSLVGSGRSSPMERSFYVARLFASAGNVESAIESLKQAIGNGFTNIKAIETLPDFNPVRRDERFVKFMKSIPELMKVKSKAGSPDNESSAIPSR